METSSADIKARPLSYCAVNQLFKYINTVAHKFHCIPATSASSERFFSVASLMLSEETSCLMPKYVNILIFIRHGTFCKDFLWV